MSDEFLPPTGPPVEDEAPLPDPDESGYGYYAVEEYSGDPADRPLADPLLTVLPNPPPVSPVAYERQPSTSPFDPPDDPPVESASVRSPDAPIDDEDAEADADFDERPLTRSGRVPFAERNWRIPLIGVLIAAVVVLVTVIVLLPDDGLEQDESTGIADLREAPTKQWDEDLDGFAAHVAADDTSMYVVVLKSAAVELVAFDLGSGVQRWATEMGPAGPSSTGSVSVVDDGLAVVVGSRAGGSFAMIDPKNGKMMWQSPIDQKDPTLEPDFVITGAAAGGGFDLSAIDVSNERVGESVHADGFFFVDDLVYLDNDGVLSTADAKTLEPSGEFSYDHEGPIVDLLGIGQDVVLSGGEQLIRVASDGTASYSFDPQVGIIRDMMPMNGDRILVSGSARMRVVALNDTDAEAATAIRSGVSPLLIHDIEGDEFIVAFDGADRGVGPATVRILRVEADDFDQVSEIELVSADGAPPVTVTGMTAYTSSFGPPPQFLAFDLNSGEQLWTLGLLGGDDPTVISNGVIVLTREADESVVGFYAKADS